jgi:hypothetical protein
MTKEHELARPNSQGAIGENMNEKQAAAVKETLKAVTEALQAGVDPDVLMGCIIRAAIEATKCQST